MDPPRPITVLTYPKQPHLQARMAYHPGLYNGQSEPTEISPNRDISWVTSHKGLSAVHAPRSWEEGKANN